LDETVYVKYKQSISKTGSLFTVWTADEKILNALGGKCVKYNVHFSGFGGETSGNLCEIKHILAGSFVFPGIHIMACKDLQDVPFQLIPSAAMLSGLICEIDDKNHKLNVTIPDNESMVRNLTVRDSDGKQHIMCESVF